MASAEQEVGDLSKVISGLLINFGYALGSYNRGINRSSCLGCSTIKDRAGMLVAGKAANINKKPIVFDPVAVGATAFRRETSKGMRSTPEHAGFPADFTRRRVTSGMAAVGHQGKCRRDWSAS